MKERKKHFGKKTRDLCEETGSLVESDCHEPDKEQSKEILCITNAAVNALSSVKDAAAEKKPDLRGGSAPKIPAPQERIIVDSAPLHINQNHQSSSSDLANMSNSSSESSRVADAINSEKRRKSGSPFELSFNGTQRVRVPSRLLREIKSPLERGSSSGESTEVPGTTGDESWSSVPVTVVRHVDGPLAWIPSVITDPSDAGRPPKILETNKEPSRDCVTSHSYEVAQLIDRAVETRVDGRLVEEMVAAAETGGRRKNSLVKGLHQGEPKSGMPVFCPEDENPSGMKVRTFALSDKEKTLKETFLRRQEQRRPLKRLVHPTVVSEPQSEGHDKREADNPVVAAAAIAAAAASAATGPFLQLQHSLEAQVTALLSNLQVLQQNQNKKQELQEKEQERKLQLQIDERLQRLEDLQKKMLEAQSIPTGHVSSSTVPRHPSSVLHSVHPMTDHMTMASLHGVPVASTTHTARGVSIGDERPQIQYSAAGRFEPHTTHAGPFNPEDPLSYSRALPPASKHKAVRNTRTQTSPQESLSSNDSPLQTPLPRKRPPVPISRYDMPRSRVKGHRSDATRRVDRVQSEPALPSGLPSYREKMTGKGRGLSEQLVSKESAVRGRVIYPSACDVAIETRTAANRTDAAPLKSETVAVLNEVGKIKTELRDILTEADKLKQGLIQQQVEKGAAHSSKSLFRRTDPSPLDEYLVEAACGPSVPEDSRTVTPTGFLPVQRSSVHHFADAEHILKDVQRRRENLENNLEAVERQREEQDLYNLVDNIPLSTGEFDGMLRIRRDVDKKIEELTSAVQREIEQDNRMAPIQRDASSPLNKPKSQGVKTSLSRATGAKRSLSTGPPDLGNRGVKKNEGKENLPEKGVLKKSKPAAKTAAPPKKSSKLTPAQKQDYVSSVYGRQPYQPQRTTSKAPYLHYHSPVNPKTAAVMAGLMAGANRAAGKPVPLQDLTSLPVKEAVEPKKTKADARKQWLSPREQPAKQNDSTRYFFHPTVDLSQVGSREGRSRVAVPMEGQLVPMAIPLGKPKTDPALRPPVATNAVQGTSEMQAQPPSPSTDSTSSGLSPVPTPARSAPVPGHSRSAQSNVAVITVYDKELGDQTDQQQKQRSKSPAKKRKKQSSLTVQVLPTVDIDSYSESSYSSPRPPFIDDIPEPLSRPHDSEYQEFRNYLAVTDMESGPQPEDQEDDFHIIPTPQNYLTLEGLTAMDGRPYNGPPFPPEHPSMPPHPSGGVLEADARQEEALQERAMEWIEQELLARIVSEMNQPLPDPTSLARPQPTPERSSMSEAEDEDADMLGNMLLGVQL